MDNICPGWVQGHALHMIKKTPRVLAIQDMSGFGRCSLTVILPVLSAMGVQVCPLPTAVLSTHTGGLGDVVFRDLTDFIMPAFEHYKRLGITFDCIYSGFLGSKEQIAHCLSILDYGKDAIKVVDPVMGDHGKAYKTCTEDLRSGMADLVRDADIITPNLTEAAMLLKEEYPSSNLTRSQIKSWLVRLSECGPKIVIITGVATASGEIANVGYDSARNAFWYIKCDYMPVSYPGTGDIFASIVIGSILNGDSLPIAMERATRFLERAIKTTYSYGEDTRHGVMLEATLPWLMKDESLTGYEIL